MQKTQSMVSTLKKSKSRKFVDKNTPDLASTINLQSNKVQSSDSDQEYAHQITTKAKAHVV